MTLQSMLSSFSQPPYRTILKHWTPVVVWAGLIFFFSTERFSSSETSPILGPVLSWLFPKFSTEQLDAIHLGMRKLGHWSEYLVLSILLMRALRNTGNGKSEARHAAWSVLLVFLYAASDEWHQSFVPSRTASFVDIIIDLFGGICGAFWVYRRHRTNRAH